MSDTISESFSPSNVKKSRVCTSENNENETDQLQEEHLNLASGILELISNSYVNLIVQDISSDDDEFYISLKTIDTNNMVVPGLTNIVNYANNHITKQSFMNIPVPVFNKCSNITIKKKT